MSHAAPTKTVSKSYAEVAREARTADKFAAKVAELEKSNERLLKQLAELRGKTGASDEDADMDDEADDRDREERIRVLTSNLRSIAMVFGEASAEHKACKEELEGLIKARREDRPLQIQLQNVDRRIDRQRQKADRLDEQVADLRERAAALQEELESTEKHLAEARGGLAELEEERKALLLREAQNAKLQEEAHGTGEHRREQQLDEHGTWQRMVGFIQQRTSQPGVDPQLAAQLASVVQMLQALCGQLPAPTMQPTQTTAPPMGQEQQGGGRGPGDPPTTPPAPPVSSSSTSQCGGAGADASGSAGNASSTPPTAPGATSQKPHGELNGGAAEAAALVDEKGMGDKPVGAGGLEGADGAACHGGGGAAAANGDAMEVEDVIRLLPQRHRTRVRDAIKKGDEQEVAAGAEARGRDRERSPRPTKGGADPEL